MSRELVIGDIHGAYKALVQCLERCGFDFEQDKLISLGDICDGWAYVYECVELLLRIQNIIVIEGNHDTWFKHWLEHMRHPDRWSQGGKGTAISYLRAAGKDVNDYICEHPRSIYEGFHPSYEFPLDPFDVPPSHHTFFKNQVLYYKDDKNRLFVHGGFLRKLTLAQNQRRVKDEYYFTWNRDLWKQAKSVHEGESLKFVEEFSEIFIGHTSTTKWTTEEITTEGGIIIPKGAPITTPMQADIIWNLDTGAGRNGKLTIMDVDTHEYWQSDFVTDLYNEPNSRG